MVCFSCLLIVIDRLLWKESTGGLRPPIPGSFASFTRLGLYHAAVCAKTAIPYESHCTIVTLTLACWDRKDKKGEKIYDLQVNSGWIERPEKYKLHHYPGSTITWVRWTTELEWILTFFFLFFFSSSFIWRGKHVVRLSFSSTESSKLQKFDKAWFPAVRKRLLRLCNPFTLLIVGETNRCRVHGSWNWKFTSFPKDILFSFTFGLDAVNMLILVTLSFIKQMRFSANVHQVSHYLLFHSSYY